MEKEISRNEIIDAIMKTVKELPQKQRKIVMEEAQLLAQKVLSAS